MILNVSGRTDIIAFYTEWFIKRYRANYVDVRNPFNPTTISRISFHDVDAILFCTKNPLPIIKYLKEIKHPILFHITLTPYKKEIEPNVPSKTKIINAIKEISKIVGIDHIVVRYDPIFLSKKYNIEYHKKAFHKMCTLLNGSVNQIIVSFLDDCKNVRNNQRILQHQNLKEQDYKEIGLSFSKSAAQNGMTVQTCFEDRNLSEYGFQKGECLSHELAYKLTGKKYKNWTARKERKCNCVQMVDIGAYNTCKHFCKYCYANYNEKQVIKNSNNHDPNSSLIIGKIQNNDLIKQRIK